MNNWINFIPKYENQYSIYGDFYDCVVFSFLNLLETKLNKAIKEKTISIGNATFLSDNGYLDDTGSVNFSDQFLAMYSGIIKGGGTTFGAVTSAVKEYGLVPDNVFDDEPRTWEQYYDKTIISQKMINLGQEFNKRFGISWDEGVGVGALENELVWATIGIDIVNYNKDIVLPPNNQPQSHAVLLVDKTLEAIRMFDSYPPHLKRLDWNYNFYATWCVYIKELIFNDNKMLKIYKQIGQKDQFIMGNDGRIYLIYNLSTLNELHNAGVIDRNAITKVLDISIYKRGADIISAIAE